MTRRGPWIRPVIAVRNERHYLSVYGHLHAIKSRFDYGIWSFSSRRTTDRNVPIQAYKWNPDESEARGETKAVNKSAFIRQHPDVPAAELVAKAKNAGITITANYVHTVRSEARASGKGPTKRGPRRKSDGSDSPSAFIRAALAEGKGPRQIMAEADQAGIKFSRRLIYAVQRTSRVGAKRNQRSKRSSQATHKPRTPGSAAGSSNDTLFRKLAVEMGLSRAHELLDDLELRLRKLLAGS